MPKGKKQTLTQEEWLEQMLVPEDEQPYDVPENWVWVVLGKTVKIKRGASPRPIKSFVTEDIGGVNWIKIGDTGDGKYVCSVKEKITKQGAERSVFVEKGTLLLSNSMSFGRPYILDVDGCIHDGWLAITVSGCFDKDYMYYALLSSDWYFEQVAVGTAVRNLNSERVAGLPCPLPPQHEQHRIVARIESLFIKLDRAKELIQTALDSFETRKAAILHQAFTGQLTAEWRKRNGITLDSWKTQPLTDVAYIQTGLAKGKSHQNEVVQMPYLRVANVQDGFLDLKEIKQIFVASDKVARYTLRLGDVLLTEGGDYDKLGRGAVWHDEIPNCLHQNHVFAVRPHFEILDSHYLAYLTGSKYGKAYFLSCSKQTTNLASINSTQLKAFPVITPLISEQKEIVRILETLLDREQQAHSLSNTLDKIDLMKKVILARAFRGQLGTNDLTEENALKRLKAMQQ